MVIRKLLKKLNTNIHNLYLVFPNNEGLISYYGLLYADDFMDETNLNKIYIVTKDIIIKESADKLIKGDHEVLFFSDLQMYRFLKSISLHSNLMGESIYKNIYFISTLYPYGEGFKVLLDGKFFNESYLVWNRILHNKDFYYAQPLKPVDENDKTKILFLA